VYFGSDDHRDKSFQQDSADDEYRLGKNKSIDHQRWFQCIEKHSTQYHSTDCL